MSPTDRNPGQIIEPQIKETFSGTQQAKLERLLSKDPMPSSMPHTKKKKMYLDEKFVEEKLQLKKSRKGLPWWYSGSEPTCQYRGHGFYPWSGKIGLLKPVRHSSWSLRALDPVSHSF